MIDSIVIVCIAIILVILWAFHIYKRSEIAKNFQDRDIKISERTILDPPKPPKSVIKTNSKIKKAKKRRIKKTKKAIKKKAKKSKS